MQDNHALALTVQSLHDQSEHLASSAASSALEAIRLALQCGHELDKQRELLQGEFDVWLEGSTSIPKEKAHRWIAANRKHAPALANGEPDQTVMRQLFLEIGLLPPAGVAVGSPSKGDASSSFWSQVKKLDRWSKTLPPTQKTRLREWWQAFGKDNGFTA